ncbi:MAG: hypothetical protein DRP25_06510 [Thermotoga sp.]|nr:MAG: hypothetical protein DRP25_06510 [Thermotoga sp.]
MNKYNQDYLLALIKFTYDHAYYISLKPVPLSSLAVILFDDIIEWFLNIICKCEKIECENFNLCQYFEAIVRTIEKRNKRLAEIFGSRQLTAHRVHRIRNHIKHDGIIVQEKEVQMARNLTLETLQDLIENYFKRSWDEISITLLIQNDQWRQDLQKAESLIQTKQYKKALKTMAEIFIKFLYELNQKVLERYKRPIIVGPDIAQLKQTILRHSSPEKLFDIINGIIDKLWYFETYYTGLIVSTTPTDFLRFWVLTPWAIIGTNGITSSDVQYEPTKQEVLYCFEFLVGLMLKWQDVTI